MKRDETIKWLESLKAEIGKSEHRALWHYAEAIDMAIEALSIDIIRCENCRYWYRKINKCNRCPSISGNWGTNDFCSHGKRRIDSEEIK